MFDRTIMRLLLSVALVFLARTVHASTIDFMFSGTGSGYLDGQPLLPPRSASSPPPTRSKFRTAAFCPSDPRWLHARPWLGDFHRPNRRLYNPHAGYGVAGMIDLNVRDILDIENPVFFSYGLNTSLGPISERLGPCQWRPQRIHHR